MRFVWNNLPVFLIWLIGASVLNNALHHIVPPVTSVIWPSLLPLVCSGILLVFALRRFGVHSRGGSVVWVAVLAGMYVLPLLHGLTVPMENSTQRMIYEFSAFAQFLVILVHARTWFRPYDWIRVFGITLAFGVILENGGIIMGMFQEGGYFLYIPGLHAPAATMIGWVNILYCVFFSLERVLPKMPACLRGIVCAFIALSVDIPFDIVATRLGWWTWNPQLDVRVWDVPLINYVAWFWALFPYGWCYYWVKERVGWTEKKKVYVMVVLIPVLLIAEFTAVLVSLWALGDRAAVDILVQSLTAFSLP
ncbi:MAG: hypothetical protein ACP5G0_04925 [Desulfomonilia bacterium]